MSVELQHYRFSVDDLLRMVQTGILPEDARVELIEGELIEVSPIGCNHAGMTSWLARMLARLMGDRAIVYTQNPLVMDAGSMVRPDLCLLHPRPDFYAGGHPRVPDVFLAIEVSDTTLPHDQKVKMPLYARAGLEEAWIVNLERRVVDVYRGPAPHGYRLIETVPPGGSVRPLAFPDLEIRVAEIFRILPEPEQKEKA